MSGEHGHQKWRNQYTVALICAIEFEMSAVRYMLDKEHDLFSWKGDSNVYILGELSGLNVVLACLPGTQGKGAAATVATNVSRTFPSVMWRFLIGIGGGVPSEKHDVRLGDVIVSMPDGEHGGIVQYDLGRDTKDGFQRKGFLCPPPTILRSAVGLMRSNHRIEENKIRVLVSDIVSRSKGLDTYARPSPASDTLFKADYPHPDAVSTCANCDTKEAVKRQRRKPNLPKIHYGLIASGDCVVKCATKRDRAAQALGGVLCFEMEAAGIATEFSCIVIRGIADYADSHKNDVWQHYAAAAAAACAKELLSCIPITRPRPGEAPLNPPRELLLPGPGLSAAPPSIDGWPGSRSTFAAGGIQGGIGNNFSVGGNLNTGNIAATHRDQLSDEATPCKPLSTVPFPRDGDFVDRPEITEWLDKQYEQSNGRFALVGLGGIGKSQLAIQFAYRIQEKLPGIYIFWVYASTKARFEEAYHDIADRLKLPQRYNPGTNVLRLVYNWLVDEQNGEWLMILDSADDMSVFYPRTSNQGTADSSTQRPLALFLPQRSNCRILVTSRSLDVAERLTGYSHNALQVSVMNSTEAKELLRSKLRQTKDEEGISKLVDALECMPLSITQAAAYITRRAPLMSVSAYLSEFRKSNERKASLLRMDSGDLRRDPEARNSIIGTW